MRPSLRYFTQRKPNYPGHEPLSFSQNALLAIGSGLMGVYTSRGDLIASLSESTSSTFLPKLNEKLKLHPEGRQILKDRPLITNQSLIRLSNLKRGTLGREYFEWLDDGKLDPDSRMPVQYIDSPTLAYTMLRYRQTHDLYHTLFSLPPTLPHELSLKVLEFSNMSLPVAALSSTFGPFRLKRRETWLKDWVPWALRTGQEGKSLVGVYWEKRWEQGIGELRRELGVERNDLEGVESRWGGYRKIREIERELRRKGEWIDEPEEW
ncbi:ubiquinone biosynthesis protein COQ4, mitochondrial [Kwoniella pini CBS 10737]|uniref:4-hydroxy-3-methoxy-5-polyprenylbenzoate decarboxylase n=1 Tax=Kwoniella pini CBS 10737 TaxID=1296096 RepID=A0A1B9ICA0_9TREE|nr:ubiquinone biosynthesis protein COQ4, mitochondrial [Kwoniella pini CBS 10737]OCF53093.1 ubiquinone biosynthesis protein COQ4, mitochondrial [Kwoniella pini CBS 10737]